MENIENAAPAPAPAPESFESGTTTTTTTNIWYILSGMFIFIILSILIINLLNLGHIFDNLFTMFKDILKWFGYNTGETVKKIVNVGAVGANAGVNAVDNTIQGGVNILEKGLDIAPKEKEQRVQDREQEEKVKARKDKALAEAEVLRQGAAGAAAAENVLPSDGILKSGYCYIGEDNGFRSCVKVGKNDQCISGDIFPTHDVCINPNLRP